MGYKPQRKIYNLKFDQYEGLVVRATSTTTRVFMEISKFSEKEDHSDEDLLELFGQFAKVLVSWNVEDDEGEPVPKTLDGLLSLEFEFVMDIVMGWMEAVAGVPAPLGQQPKDTATLLLEASIPMEPLPESQAS